MYTVTTNAHFDSAHFLANYNGKCRNIHGHRWNIQVEVASEELSREPNMEGMVMDFSVLKKDLKVLADNLDHSLIIEKGSLKEATMKALQEEEFRIIEVAFRPTAENFAKYVYEEMKNKGYAVTKATVYETPNNAATYTED